MPNKQFNTVPTISRPRTKFDLSYDHKLTMNVGDLVPLGYVQEIYPGDTFDCDMTVVTRLTSSYLRPVCDNLYLDVMFFFVPHRLVFEDFYSVLGENKNGPWAQQNPVSVPTVPTTISSQVYESSVADYLGCAPGYYPGGCQILPFRGFAKIYADWFQDENFDQPMNIHKGDAIAVDESFNNNAWSAANYFGKLPHVNKFKDVFTSALPGTQKGSAAGVSMIGQTAPIVAGTSHLFGGKWFMTPSGTFTGDAYLKMSVETATGNYGAIGAITTGNSVVPADNWSTNMVANLSEAALSIPDIRNAFQLQKILELSARAGTRAPEIIMSHFGVASPDARLQRSEYLGGKRMPLSVQQVAQTTRTDSAATQLGSLGAFSLSNGRCGYTKGFVEHGYVFAVGCIRNYHTYSQGWQKSYQRTDRFDFYSPVLANLSEVPVYKSEIYADVASEPALKGNIWGYQEAWYDLRSHPNTLAGQMRPTSSLSLDIWHYGDDYANQPTLNAAFLKEVPDFVDRTLAVKYTLSGFDQFMLDIYYKQTAIRCLPAYSVPGLIDHH